MELDCISPSVGSDFDQPLGGFQVTVVVNACFGDDVAREVRSD